MLHVTDTIAIPDAEIVWQYARSGGPGGQNVNKVESKATLRWAMIASTSVPAAVKDRLRATHPARMTTEGEFLVMSQRYRDQERNRADCLEKLAKMVRAVVHPPTPRKKTRPTKASQARRLAEKKHQSVRKARRRTDES